MNIDLKKNQLLNAVIQNLGTAPENPILGQIYFNTVTNTLEVYNGAEWVKGGMTAVTLGNLVAAMSALTIADADLLTAADVTDSNTAKKLTVISLYNYFKGKADLIYMPKVTAATAYNKNYSTTVADIKMNGTQSLGTADTLPRADHVHPTDTSRAAATHGHALTGTEITGILPLTKGGTGVNVKSYVALLNKLGFIAATCSTAAATVAKTVTAANFVLVAGAVVGIKFAEAVPAAATLNINATGAIAIKVDGAAIGATDILASKFALLQYDGTAWNLLNHASTATTGNVQTQLNLLAPKASPAFTGTPTAPTPTASDSSTKIATTAFVMNQIPITAPAETAATIGDLIAAAAATALDDTDKMPFSDTTATGDLKHITWTNMKAAIKTYTDGFYAVSGHVHATLTDGVYVVSLPTLSANKTFAVTTDIPTAYASNPAMNGTASAGSSGNWSKGDHVHPVDVSRAPATHVGTGGTAQHPLAVAESTDVTPSKAGFMSGYEKYKLSGIEAGAQVNDVTSVAGRVGAVTLTKSDVGLANVTNDAQIKALGSAPTVGKVPTWVAANELAAGYSVETTLTGSTTALARADAIKAYIDALLAGTDAMIFKGTVGTGGTHTITAFNALVVYNAGWAYKVIEAGTIKGKVCEVGDMVVATADRNTTGAVDADWIVLQTNIDGAVIGPASAVDNRIAVYNGITGKLIKDGGKTIAELSLVGHNHDGVYTKKVSGNFGIANTAAYVITHGLGTTDILVSLWDNLTGEQIDADVVKTNTTQITVTINPVSATFPATDQFRVVVIG